MKYLMAMEGNPHPIAKAILEYKETENYEASS